MRPLQPLHRSATRAQGPLHTASILRMGAKPTAVKAGLLGGGVGVGGVTLKDGGNGGRSVQGMLGGEAFLVFRQCYECVCGL